MGIKIELLKEADRKSLFRFELENRAFFETLVPSRGDQYFLYDHFSKGFFELLEEQQRELSYFYLIKNDSDQIVGRVNLVDIDKENNSGHIGYRVGEAFLKQGIASKALNLILDEAKKKNVMKIFAKTTLNNIGSQKVLENNGFIHISSTDKDVELNGERLTFVHYVWDCKDGI